MQKTLRLKPVLIVCLAYLAPLHAATLELSQINLPPGFHISLYAHVPQARELALGDDGTVYVGTGNDAVYGIVPARDGESPRVYAVAKGLDLPNGVAFHDGKLFIAEMSRILRIDDPAKPMRPQVIFDALPSERSHGRKTIRFGPDGLLYVAIGAPCNICVPDSQHGVLARLDANAVKPQLEVIARGVRNSVGFDWHPVTHELWFTDNGRDMLGNDVPGDELNRLSGSNSNFGFPYCHQGNVSDPQFGSQRHCNEFTPPVQVLGAHVAALGMRFYTGTLFPPEYRQQIFIAEHGSWNRQPKAGYRIALVKLNGHQAVSYQAFASGWLRNEQVSGRPVDVLVMPDGALLVSDDDADAVYRIDFRQQPRQ